MEEIYPEGMLDRDQRTAKIRLCQCENGDITQVPKRTRKSFCTKFCSIISNILSINKKTKFSYLMGKKGYLVHSFQRLKHVLLVLVYFTLIHLPASHTAPLTIEMSTGWWNNPCNMDITLPFPDAVAEDFYSWNMDDLINQVYITNSEANRTKEDYAQKTFSKSFDELAVDRNYWWMPKLPKKYKEQVSENFLKTKMPADLLKEIYRNLQVYGVSIDVAANEAIANSPDEIFVLKRVELRALLCEFNTFLLSVNIVPSSDVTDSVMPEDLKGSMDATGRATRNYITYMEYLNCLEYLDQTLKYLKVIQQDNK